MRLQTFLAAGLLLAACGSDPESAAPAQGDVASERAAIRQSDSLRTIRQEGGQPGIPGSDLPEQFWPMDDGECYAYGQRVVRIARLGVGEVVDVFAGSGREQCAASRAQAVFSSGSDDGTATFFGMAGALLLIEKTIDDRHVIRVIDLAGGAVVLETHYEEPVEIREGGLFYGEAAAEFVRQEELNATGVNCPESRQWFNDSLAVGVSIRSRFDLASHVAEQTDDVTCIPLL